MTYDSTSNYTLFMFPRYFWWVFGCAIVAVLAGAISRRRGTLIVLALTVVFGLVFRFWPQSHAWNLRFLPFWYLGLFLLAGIGAAEIVVAFASSAMRFVFVDRYSQAISAHVDETVVPAGAGIPSEIVVPGSQSPSAALALR